MNLALKIAMLSCGALVALGTASCKVSECTENLPDGGTIKKDDCLKLETTIEYRELRDRTGGQAWTSGRAISITNHNGPLRVALGDDGSGRVTFLGKAFTREPNDAEGAQRAKERLTALGDPVFGDGAGVLTLAAPGGTTGGHNVFDGYDLTVWIPADFDAALEVVNDNGLTTLYGADGTTSTNVSSHDIKATNLKHSINLFAKIGDIDARGTPSGQGNVIRADLGAIYTFLGAVNLSITATSDSGMVNFPPEWMQNVAADKMSGAATLGDGSGTLGVTSGGGNITFYVQ